MKWQFTVTAADGSKHIRAAAGGPEILRNGITRVKAHEVSACVTKYKGGHHNATWKPRNPI